MLALDIVQNLPGSRIAFKMKEMVETDEFSTFSISRPIRRINARDDDVK